eukprot:TRINITY_DN99_c0_g2_i2.p1 TRINITY_DN99_c0_g2~~TRINITY_DN99_c0_g2_i2.p1  ORF type:complete len:309 (-),score=48.01 TRINITY_DN99_c0_g2_i2:115-1041(-)
MMAATDAGAESQSGERTQARHHPYRHRHHRERAGEHVHRHRHHHERARDHEHEHEPVDEHVFEQVLEHVLPHAEEPALLWALSRVSKACLSKCEAHCREICYEQRWRHAAEREEARAPPCPSCRWLLLWQGLHLLGRFDESLVTMKGSVLVSGSVASKVSGNRADNVFVLRRVQPGEELFVEFLVEWASDGSIGVTEEVPRVSELSGWSSCNTHSWIFEEQRTMFGTGNCLQDHATGITPGDRKAVFVSAPKQQVTWFKNGSFVFTNRPHYHLLPPKKGGYGIYCELGQRGDRISIVNCGAGLPFTQP